MRMFRPVKHILYIFDKWAELRTDQVVENSQTQQSLPVSSYVLPTTHSHHIAVTR